MKIFIKDSDDPLARTPLLGITRSHDLIFHFEKDKWTFVKTPQEADIIPLMSAPFNPVYRSEFVTVDEQYNYIKPLRPDQWIIMLFYTHATEEFDISVKNRYMVEKWEPYTNNVLTVDLNRVGFGPRHIYHDFSFNYIKAIFTEYDRFDFTSRMWTHYSSKEAFQLPQITEFKPKKRFLIPNIIRDTAEFKEIARQRIKDDIIRDEDCFYSDHTNDENAVYLEPKDTSERFRAYYNPTGSNLFPIKDSYYTESVVSVYGETIGTGRHGVEVITEKTYVPLVRGHFIMPFSYSGIIKDILSMGFQLPYWIDYSYDTIFDDNKRLDAYVKCVLKLRDMPLQQLAKLANQDINIIKHNRNLFYSKPYMSFYDEIKSKTKL